MRFGASQLAAFFRRGETVRLGTEVTKGHFDSSHDRLLDPSGQQALVGHTSLLIQKGSLPSLAIGKRLVVSDVGTLEVRDLADEDDGQIQRVIVARVA